MTNGERTTCEADTGKMGNEESKTNADRSDECGAVLLGCEHENREDQERSQKHLNEEAASDIGVFGECGGHRKFL